MESEQLTLIVVVVNDMICTIQSFTEWNTLYTIVVQLL